MHAAQEGIVTLLRALSKGAGEGLDLDNLPCPATSTQPSASTCTASAIRSHGLLQTRPLPMSSPHALHTAYASDSRAYVHEERCQQNLSFLIFCLIVRRSLRSSHRV